MGNRLDLQTLLEDIIKSDNVYFQPPSNFQMNYPCIVYSVSDVETKYANNLPYGHLTRYQVKVIDANPDSLIPSLIANLPTSSFERKYVSANLNNTIYNIYF